MNKKLSSGAIVVCFALFCAGFCGPKDNNGNNPYGSLTIDISGNIPEDVNTDLSNVSPGDAQRPFFDQFAWQVFIALIWPADTNGGRGTADNPNDVKTFIKHYPPGASPNTATVFMSWQDVTSMMPTKGEPPEWNSTDLPPALPCTNASSLTGLSSNKFLKFTLIPDYLQAGPMIPIIDQNKNYTMYNITINKTEYNEVREQKWYLKKDQPPQITLPAGSIEVKGAWREIKDSERERYYSVEALVADPGTIGSDKSNPTYANCEVKLMGLVGFHIYIVTKDFPEGIMATFQHINNTVSVGGQKPAYNNGNVSDRTKQYGYSRHMPPYYQSQSQRKNLNIWQVAPIPTTPSGPGAGDFPYGYNTAAMNKVYQEKLKETIWGNYELAITQWPVSNNGGATKMYPDSNVANAVIETYTQIGTSSTCFGCHSGAVKSNYSFSLKLRARGPAY